MPKIKEIDSQLKLNPAQGLNPHCRTDKKYHYLISEKSNF